MGTLILSSNVGVLDNFDIALGTSYLAAAICLASYAVLCMRSLHLELRCRGFDWAASRLMKLHFSLLSGPTAKCRQLEGKETATFP